MTTAVAPAVAQQSQQPAIGFRRAAIEKQSQLAPVVFAAGQTVPTQLISQGYLERLMLIGSFTLTETTAANIKGDTYWNVIARLSLTDSGGGVIYSLSGYNSFIHSKFMMGHRAWVDGSSSTLVYSAPALGASVTPILSWEIPVANNERDLIGLLPNQSDAYKFTLNVQWGALADLVGTVGDIAFSGSIIPFYDYFTIPTALSPAGQPQQVTPDLFGTVHQVTDISTNQFGSAPTTNNRLNLPVGRIYRGLAFVIRDAGVREDDLSAYRVRYGDDVSVWQATNQMSKSEAYLRNGRDLPVGVYLFDRMSDSGLRPGLDYRRDYIDTRQLAQFWVEMDFTSALGGQCTVDVIMDTFIARQGVIL